MQWFRLTVENRRNVTKFHKALSFLAELRKYHHKYIYKLVKSTTSLVMHIISVANALKNISHTLFFFYKNIFDKNIEAEICEILRIL